MKPGFGGVTLWLSAALAVVLALAPVPAAAFHDGNVHLEGGAWFPKLTVEARSSGFGIEGNRLTESDLGLEDPDVVIVGAVTFRIARRHTLRVEGFGFSVDGGRDSGETFTFNGRTFPVGTPINTEADVVFAGGDYGFDLVHTEPVALGLTLGVRFVSAEAKINAPLLNQEAKGDYQTALPAVGVVGVLHPIPVPLFRSLALTGRLTGGTIGDLGSFIDVDGAIEWLPIPVLAIRVGYRYFHGKGENDDDEAKVELSGPYASLTLSF